jgi:hypothetical protein
VIDDPLDGNRSTGEVAEKVGSQRGGVDRFSKDHLLVGKDIAEAEVPGGGHLPHRLLHAVQTDRFRRFRVEVSGIENLQETGAALVVSTPAWLAYRRVRVGSSETNAAPSRLWPGAANCRRCAHLAPGLDCRRVLRAHR